MEVLAFTCDNKEIILNPTENIIISEARDALNNTIKSTIILQNNDLRNNFINELQIRF